MCHITLFGHRTACLSMDSLEPVVSPRWGQWMSAERRNLSRQGAHAILRIVGRAVEDDTARLEGMPRLAESAYFCTVWPFWK
jgi:hypothetical protein